MGIHQPFSFVGRLKRGGGWGYSYALPTDGWVNCARIFCFVAFLSGENNKINIKNSQSAACCPVFFERIAPTKCCKRAIAVSGGIRALK
jgi:hypothetical protein